MKRKLGDVLTLIFYVVFLVAIINVVVLSIYRENTKYDSAPYQNFVQGDKILEGLSMSWQQSSDPNQLPSTDQYLGYINDQLKNAETVVRYDPNMRSDLTEYSAVLLTIRDQLEANTYNQFSNIDAVIYWIVKDKISFLK